MKFYPAVEYYGGVATFYNFFTEENLKLIPDKSYIQLYPRIEAKDVHEAAAKFAERRFLPYQEFVFSEEKTLNGKHFCTAFMVRVNEEKLKAFV